MRFKIDDWVFFLPEYESTCDMSVNKLIDRLQKIWGGKIRQIRIDSEKKVYYSIQTYSVYGSPYEYFENIQEECCFERSDEAKIMLIDQKLKDLDESKIQLENRKKKILEEMKDE